MSAQAQLALHMLERESQQEANDRVTVRAARQERLAALEKEVSEMREAARSGLRGALASAALTTAGGALQTAAAARKVEAANEQARAERILTAKDAAGSAEVARITAKANTLESVGSMTSKLADPVQTVAGRYPEGMHNADAAAARKHAEEASWRQNDAEKHADQAAKNQDKLQQMLENLLNEQHRAIDSLIGRI